MSKKKSIGKIFAKAIQSLEKKKEKDIKRIRKELRKAKLKMIINKRIERKNIFIEKAELPKPKGSIFFKK